MEELGWEIVDVSAEPISAVRAAVLGGEAGDIFEGSGGSPERLQHEGRGPVCVVRMSRRTGQPASASRL